MCMKMNLYRKSLALFLSFSLVFSLVSRAAAVEGDTRYQADESQAIWVYDDVWRYEDWLFRIQEDGTIELKDFSGEMKEWEIPGEIDGRRVTAIGDRCFSNAGYMSYYTDQYPDYHREYIRSVTVPEGIVRIGDYAFEDCFNLIEVSLPQSLLRIGEGAFARCHSLMRIELPDGLQELGAYAFQDCQALIKMNIPDTVQLFGTNPFAGCNHLASLDVSADHPFLRCEDGMLYDVTQQKLIFCTTKLWEKQMRVPENTRIIGEFAFASAPCESVELPESLEVIEDYAFCDCTELLDLVIPENVRSIGNNPVRGCLSIRDVIVSGNQDIFSYKDKTLTDEKAGKLIAYLGFSEEAEPAEENIPSDKKAGNLFAYLRDLIAEGKEDSKAEGKKSVDEKTAYDGIVMHHIVPLRWVDSFYMSEGGAPYTVQDGIREIGGYAFYRTRVNTVIMPDSVCAIGEGVFMDCQLLEQCRIPSRVRQIPDRAFYCCYLLSEMILPEGIESVGAYAFRSSGIPEIHLPLSVRSIGRYAFAHCSVLDKVELRDALTMIPKGAFSGCLKCESIHLPESVAVIEEEAFAGCEILCDVNLPEKLTNIPKYCFYDSGIVSVNIPSRVTYIGDHAFRTGSYNGSCLTEVTLAEGIRYIGNCAFFGGQFKEISIPKSLVGSGSYVFSSNAEQVYLPDGMKKISDGMFAFCGLRNIEIPDSVEYIGDSAFFLSSITSITIPDSVHYIGDGAFADCSKLVSVRLPGDWVTISGNPFYECEELKEVKLNANHPNLSLQGNLLMDDAEKCVVACLPYGQEETCKVPEGTEVIGESAFERVELPEGIILPEGLREIRAGAFGFSSLKEIHLPDTVEAIGDWAFENSAIEKINLPGSLKKIGKMAFHSTCISDIIIPESVEYIGEDALDLGGRIEFLNGNVHLEGSLFEDCYSAQKKTEIVIPENHPTLEMYEGNLYSKDDSRLIEQMSENPIRQGTLVIEEGAVSDVLILPESVEIIRIYGKYWYDKAIEAFVVPGSAAEAFVEQGVGNW